MRIEVVHPGELGAGEVRAWRALQDHKSPYLTPDWAKVVGKARPDARVAVIEDGLEIVGFLGVQRPSRFAAMGLGAPIADYQGLVGAADLPVTATALCRALKVGRIDLTHVPDGQDFFAPFAAGGDGSWLADVRSGVEAWRAAQRVRRPEFVRQTDKKLRKLSKERGVVVTPLSRHRGHFEQMLAWKRLQLARTGQPAIWSTRWVSEVLHASFEAEGPHFSGAFFTLTSGDDLVAAAYFLRSEGVLHDWIVAHNPAYEAYSPGVLISRAAVEWAGENGLDEVDFGPGDYQYKRQLSNDQRRLVWGSAAGASASGLVRRAAYAARARIERGSKFAELPGKAMRRIDVMRGLAAPGAR